MECNKCHFIYKEEDTKKFSCNNHIICKTCFYNIIMKDLINNINNNVKTYSIICKCNQGTLNFDFDDLKKIELPSNYEEIKTCSLHNNELFQFYDKTDKKLLCNKCNEDPKNKDHEKIKIDDLKQKIKEKNSKLDYATYEQMNNYMKSYFENFVQNSKKYYEEEIAKMELLIAKIKTMENIIKEQMEKQIEREKILFNLIDVLYKKNYENLKILLNNDDSTDNKTKYGYRFYKQLSKVKFNFGEFDTEHQEEIIPEIDKILKDIDDNLSKKQFKTNIKYPYFELIKSFSKTNDYKQASIISCIAANKITNEISVGYRDYSIEILRPQGSNYESFQKITDHKGEVSTLLYINNYLISGSKDKTLKIWEPNPVPDSNNKNTYILRQTITFEREIKKLNKYFYESQLGFLVASEESSFRLFLKKDQDEKNKMNLEEENKKEGETELLNEKEKEPKTCEEIFEIKQVLNEHDNEVNEAIQIKNNNDIISGSKDMTIVVWKDYSNCLGYESEQIISASNEVQSVCPFGNKGFAFAINGSYEIKIYDFNNEEKQYENICVLNEEYCHSRPINQIILLKDNRLASCSYDSTIKIISFNPLTKELREDQELEDENSVNSIAETGNGKLISGGHYKHLIVYKRS